MRKIKVIIIHPSTIVKNDLKLLLNKHFPVVEVVGDYGVSSIDLTKSLKKVADLFLISSEINLDLIPGYISKIKDNSDFILIISQESEALLGFKHGAIDVIDEPVILEKLLFSLNKFYWKFFSKF